MFSNVILTHAQVQSKKNVAKNDSTFTIELDEVLVTGTSNHQRVDKCGLMTEVKDTPLTNLAGCTNVNSQLPEVISIEG